MVCQSIFLGLDTGWQVKLAMDGTVESWDEETTEGVIEKTSDDFVGIWEKTIDNPPASL